jgi:hypothetical protein
MAGDLLLAIGDVPLHLVDVYFADSFTIFVRVLIRSVHVNIHDVFRDHLHINW